MSVLHFIRFYCIFHVIFVFAIGLAEAKYKLKLVSLERCKIAPNREYKNPPLTFNMSAKRVDRQTTLVQVNFTVKARVGPVYFGVRGYQVQQSSSRDLVLNLEKIPCDNAVTLQLIKTLNLKLDKNCYSKPGNFSADKINIQNFAWILTKTMTEPGKYSYELEVSTPKGVAACIYFICDITVQK